MKSNFLVNIAAILSAIHPVTLGFQTAVRGRQFASLQARRVFQENTFAAAAHTRTIRTTSLNMIRTKGLEKREEGATPLRKCIR